MGSQVSVDSSPLSLHALVSSKDTTINNNQYKSNIKAWSVLASATDIEVHPIDVNTIENINNRACYIVIHLYRTNAYNSQPIKKSIFEDIEDNITPRGLEHLFASGEEDNLRYDLYLWHGTESLPLTRAVAVARTIELENKLQEKNMPEVLIGLGAPIPLNAESNTPSPNIHLYRTMTGEKRQDTALRLLLGIDNAKQQAQSPSDVPEPSPRVVRFTGFHLQMPLKTQSDTDSMGSASTSASGGRSSFRLSLESVERTMGEEAPTPRRERTVESADVTDDHRPMSGNALLQIHRKICSKVNDFIFLGGNYIARDKDILQKNGITHIVNAALTVCECYFGTDFSYHAMSLYDAGTESIIGAFFGVIDFVERAVAQNGKVYIHCFEGVSRSSTLVLAYLMWKYRTPFDVTLDEVKNRRPVTSPNSGFIVQLIQWEKMLANPSYYLYRMSALNDMYDEHGELMAKLCSGSSLDSRTCFVLHAHPMNRIFIWIGNNLIIDALQTEAHKFAGLVQKYFSPNTEIVVLTEEQAATNEEFKEALSRCPVDKIVKEDPYPDIKNLLKKSARKSTPNLVAKPNSDLFQLKNGLLFEYPSLDQIPGFDADDLESDTVYVLQPQGENFIYVWVGEEAMEERRETLDYIAEDVGKVFISKKCLGGGTKIVGVEQDNEPEEFWDYFQ
jgi:hypothetical protein